MNFDDIPEHAMLRDSVRRFFDRELPERRIREMDRARKIPRDLWTRFAELGWMGLSVPAEFGGSGADAMTAAVFTEELARRFPSLATDWLLVSMTARVLTEAGSPAHKAELLPRLARGEWLMAFGMTEPDGSTPPPPPAPVTTPPRPSDGGACLGSLFVTTSPRGAAIVVDGVDTGSQTSKLLPAVPCGTRKVRVTLEGFEDMEREIVVAKGGVAELEIFLTQRRAALRVTSTPEAATLFVDGVSRGTTPFIDERLEPGEHRLRLELPGFVPQEWTVHLRPGENTLHRVPMIKCRGWLTATSVPADAVIAIDGGRAIGRTPLVPQQLRCGSYVVTATLPTHETAIRRITVEHDKTAALELEFVPRRSVVQIDVDPPDAEATIATHRSTRSPFTVELPWGSHRLHATRKGYESVTTVVQVNRPGPLPERVRLNPRPVPVTISTFGYEGIGGLQGVLTLGLLTSEYAVEIDGHSVFDTWRIRSRSSTIRLEPGPHRMRILIRTWIGREPLVFHDERFMLDPASANHINVNFLLGTVNVNAVSQFSTALTPISDGGSSWIGLGHVLTANATPHASRPRA